VNILALYGAGGSPEDWNGVADAFEGSHRLIPLTLEPPWDWESVLDRVEPFAADNPVVMGMSLGGMVAAMWGRRHPECPAVINLDGHGVPTQEFRYLPEERAEVADAIARLREVFAEYGQPELQQAMEELDCLTVFREVRCPMLLTVATKPMPGQELFAAYHRGLVHDLALLSEAKPNISVSPLDLTHAMVSEDPSRIADVVGKFLAGR